MINKVAKCSKPIVKNKKIARKTLKKKQTNVVKKTKSQIEWSLPREFD